MVRNGMIGLAALSAVSVLAVLCTLRHQPLIEAELSERANAALEREGLSKDVSAAARDGRELVLVGRVDTPDGERRAIVAVSGIRGVRAVVSHLTVRAASPLDLPRSSRPLPSTTGELELEPRP